MIVYVPKASKSKFSYYLYEIGRMMSNNGKSNIYTSRDCNHTYKAEDTWYSFDPTTAEVAATQGIILPSTEFTITNPVENDNWKLLGIFPASPTSIDKPKILVESDRKIIPSNYFTDELICEHCHKKINRKQLWLFQSKKDQEAQIDDTHTVHVNKGDFRMVGSTCIEVYTGFTGAEIRKIKQMIDEAQILGETSIDHFDANELLKHGNKVKYSLQEKIAIYLTIKNTYGLNNMQKMFDEILAIPLNSLKPYDSSIWEGILPLSDDTLDIAQTIINYYEDPSNGTKLLKNESLYRKAERDFKQLEFCNNYSSLWSNVISFYFNQPDPLDFSDEEKWVRGFTSNKILPSDITYTINADDIQAFDDQIIITRGYDVFELPPYASFKDNTLVVKSDKVQSISIQVTDTRNTNYMRVKLLDNEYYNINADDINIMSTKIVTVDGKPFIEPVQPNNKFVDCHYGDIIHKDIEYSRYSGNGWYEILDTDGYLYATYEYVPPTAKSFSASFSKTSSYRGVNKTVVSKISFSDKTIAEGNKPTETQGPFLGNVGDEVVVDIKYFHKQQTKGKYGDFYIYYIKDTAGHDVKIMSPKDNIIPDNVKLIKATISKQETYNGKESTVLNPKSIEILSTK